MKPLLVLLFIFASLSAMGQKNKEFQITNSDRLDFCNCDSIYNKWPPKPDKKGDGPEYTGDGWNMLYNFKGNVAQCGYFKKFYVIYGLQFKYDPEGNLIDIKKFFNAKLIGSCGKPGGPTESPDKK